jgi:hypothetical protein
MIELKRYIRPGLLVSVIGHLGALIVGLVLVSADPLHPPPPEAMVVEVVRPDELPRFEGTLSNLHSSGSEIPSPADGKGAVTQAPPPKPRSQPQQQTQQRSTPPREAQEVPAPRPPAPEVTQAELVRAEKTRLSAAQMPLNFVHLVWIRSLSGRGGNEALPYPKHTTNKRLQETNCAPVHFRNSAGALS